MTRSSTRRSSSSRRTSAARRKSNTGTYIGVGVVVAILIAAIGFAVWRGASRNVGERIPDMGVSLHLPNAEDIPPVPYNSNPPTSGYHWGGGTAPWGILNEPVPDTLTVHNIEHGGIVIHYRQGLDQARLDQLTGVARSLLEENPCVVMVPRPAEQLDTPIALTAWNYLMPLETVDEESIRAFFNAHIGRGPEAVCRP
jgi:hypothetical protein